MTKRKPLKYEYKGTIRNIAEIAKMIGIKHNSLYNRLRDSNFKITPQTFVAKNESQIKLFVEDSEGNKISLAELARQSGIDYKLILERYYSGYRTTQVLTAQSQKDSGV